jgi:hypothetical protein
MASTSQFERVVDDTEVGPLPASATDNGEHLHLDRCDATARYIITVEEPRVDSSTGMPDGNGTYLVQYHACGEHHDDMSVSIAPWYVVRNVRQICNGSHKPVGAGSRCHECGQSFGHPHPANKVVGSLAPIHEVM